MLSNPSQLYYNNTHNGGGVCLKGKVYKHKQGYYFVKWYDRQTKKSYYLYNYNGEKMYHPKIADKLLGQMQNDEENGIFCIDKYLTDKWVDVSKYLWEWLGAIEKTISPATYKDYHNSIKNHLGPFFKQHNCRLHEIRYDILVKLLNFIQRSGKGKMNVMMCLHSCLVYAWRSKRIPEMPPFPEKKHYRITEPEIKWLSSDRQMAIVNAIPVEHRPIFLWLKYHLRRPGEAMVIHKIDYDPELDAFIIRRSISNRREVESTKTGAVHVIPCHPEFQPYLKRLKLSFGPYLFTCNTSRMSGQRYTREIMSTLWKNACRQLGEDISLYAGMKHSSCCQFINEAKGSMSDLREITDHARLDSVKKYARMELARKRELMSRKVIPLGARKVQDAL